MRNTIADKITKVIFNASIVIFITALNFSHNPPGAWNYQFMPFLNNSSLADITFLDSLTGYAVTGDGISGNDTNYVLKTTDAGYNWNILFSRNYDFQRVTFLNTDTGYVLHGDEILRTTDAAESWSRMPVPPDNFGFYDMYPISYDTMWVCFPYIGGDYVYRTTNAGIIWTRQLQNFSITKIYMYNGNLGFTSGYPSNNFYKTTNSGINWNAVAGNDFVDIYFIDSLNGWKAKGDMKKTIDGGVTWIKQSLPNNPNFLFSSMDAFSNINADTIWGSGVLIRLVNQFRGILYRTTNSGNNWAYQVPDTSIHNIEYSFNYFSNKNIGWFYTEIKNGIHTTIGGDTNFITNIKQNIILSHADFVLNQNYPNPFNPVTIINYELPASRQGGGITNFVSLKVYDILGTEVAVLVNEKKSAGSYDVEFNGANLPSGIYFYTLRSGEFTETKRMILMK